MITIGLDYIILSVVGVAGTVGGLVVLQEARRRRHRLDAAEWIAYSDQHLTPDQVLTAPNLAPEQMKIIEVGEKWFAVSRKSKERYSEHQLNKWQSEWSDEPRSDWQRQSRMYMLAERLFGPDHWISNWLYLEPVPPRDQWLVPPTE